MSKALQNGIEALKFLSTKLSAGVTEIADAIGVDKSTAYRIMETLMESNFVEKNNDTLKYKIGPAILNLSSHFYSSRRVVNIARPYMKKLSEVTRESVHLAVLSNNSAVIIEQVLADTRVVVNAEVGKIEPLHCSSIGKCILAYMDKGEREKTLSEISYDVYTENTINNSDKLRKETELIIKQGYAVDDRELCDDVVCVAVPVFNSNGKCLYTLGISGTAQKMKDEHLNLVIDKMKTAGQAISYELGYINQHGF